MTSPRSRLLTRLGRWPRRLAALCCLVLAVSSAAHAGHPAVHPTSLAAHLGTGQVAVPVPLSESSAVALFHVGDHIGLCSSTGTSALIADHLLVLRVVSTDQNPGVLVAADRGTALRIAHASGREVVAVLDKSP